MLRLFSAFTLQSSNALPYSCSIISLYISVELFVYKADVDASFQMNELHFSA